MPNKAADEVLATARKKCLENKTLIYLVDAHPLQNEYLSLLIQKSNPSIQCRAFVTLKEIYRAYKKGLIAPALLILETQLPDALGLSALREIPTYWNPPPPILVYSGAQHLNWQAQCLETGASGFVEKTASIGHLLDSILQLLPTAQPQSAQSTIQLIHLKRRHRQIITLLNQGLSNGQIADQLHIKLATVNIHCHRLYKIAGVHSRLQLLHFARKQGWLL